MNKRIRMGLTVLALALVASAAVVVATPNPAVAEELTPQFTPVKRYNVLRRMVFPVVGVTKYWSGFGDCRDRCKREHHGVDILTYGYKGLPVVAATDGTVVKVTYNEGNAGCSVRIRDKYRWETRYMHLNNDIPGTDTVGAPCPAPGIEVGTEVVAGQIIGYVGDSGNAENTAPHLHFELRSRNGYPIDPYRSLKASRKITYEWLPTNLAQGSIAVSTGTFLPGGRTAIVVSADDVERLNAVEGETYIIDSPIIAVDRGDPMIAINAMLDLDPDHVVVFSDPDERWLEDIVRANADNVHSANFEQVEAPSLRFEPDTGEAENLFGAPDRFTTLIAGRTDRISRRYQAFFEQFALEHKVIVMQSDRYAPKSIGEPSWSFPGADADDTVFWWPTGDGWTATDSPDDVPYTGFAYLTERRALPWTLTFLADLAELPAMPVWRSW